MPESVQTPAIPSSLYELTQALRQAIRDELNARQTPTNGKPLSVPLCDGHVQARYGRHHHVTFRSPLMPLQGYLQETQGELVIDGRPHPCIILGLTLDQLTLSLTADLRDFIPEARLSIDRMRLLLVLDKRLANIQAHPQDYVTSLAMKCFNPASTPTLLEARPIVGPDPSLNQEQFEALLQAMSHDFAYIWGPPGTGKTMVIGACSHLAHQQGRRVLIAANTNSAVDQALEAVLTRLPNLSSGDIVRYGLQADDAAPSIKSVTLDAITTGAAERLEQRILSLKETLAALNNSIQTQERLMTLRQDLASVEEQIHAAQLKSDSLHKESLSAADDRTQLSIVLAQLQEELDSYWRASAWKKLFLRRQAQIQSDLFTSRMLLDEVLQQEKGLAAAQQVADLALTDLHTTKRLLLTHLTAQHTLDTLPQIEDQLRLNRLAHRSTQEQLTHCQRELLQLEAQVIQGAKIVATTLTRTYSAPLLEQERFDVVIIDEGSMASPPALFTALCLATHQVIIVGDFLQLPPIAEATTAKAQQWLATDIYRLAQICHDNDPRVAALRTQYRMHPDIAAVAAQLYQRAGLEYRTDQRIRLVRQPLVDQGPLPGKALAFMDTSDQSCWIDKDYKGSPSNRTHAELAVRLATQALKEHPHTPPSISIISPYRHQVRLIQQLIQEARLTDHVEIGTIHSFQGRQSDIVIFDTTVTGDLTRTMLGRCVGDQSPSKLMNVAFTRGKSKLIILAHGPSLATLINVPDSLLWDAYQLALTQNSVIPSKAMPLSLQHPVTGPAPLTEDLSHAGVPTSTNTKIDVIPLKRTPKLYLIRKP